MLVPATRRRQAFETVDRRTTAEQRGWLSVIFGATQTRSKLYDLLDHSIYRVFDDNVFNFDVPS